MVDPDTVVKGVGAVALPVPPVATVYHNKLLPVAVNALATLPCKLIEAGALRLALLELVKAIRISVFGLGQ